MKRKFLIVFLTIICALCLAFALTACGGGSSNNGDYTDQSQPNDDDDDDYTQSYVHTHTLTKTERAEATCATEGNIEYWYCSGCSQYFSDEAATTTILKENTVIPALGHTYDADDVCTVCREHKPTEGLTYEYYYYSAHGYSVSLGTATDENIYVPSTYNGEPIVAINSDGFKDCTTLKSINLPDTIVNIGGYAFAGCTALESVTLPDSLAYINSYVFSGCTALENITISDSLVSIATHAFENCTALTSVYYTGTASQWASISFNNTVSNPLYYGGNLYLNDTLATDIAIENITEIRQYAFYNCPTIKSVTIGDGVTTISTKAFSYCPSLKNVTIGSDVTGISYQAFYSCTALEELTINGAITSTDFETFSDCTALKSVTLADGITTIGDYAFMDCTALESIIIPDSVTYIGYGAFYNCSALESVTLSSAITTIYGGTYSRGTFNSCSSLKSIAIPDSVTSIGEKAFYDCSSLRSITVGENSLLEEIGSDAFRNCYLLTSIIIPSNVTTIGGNAFYYCYKLVEVYNLSSLSLTNSNTFQYAKNIYTATEGSSGLFTEGDFLFYQDKTSSNDTYYLLAYNGSDEEITLPSTINNAEVNYEIYKYAFYNEQTVTSITIPVYVTNIGTYAFSGCTSEILWKYTIGDSFIGTLGLTTLNAFSFAGYAGTSLTIHSSVTTVKYDTFYNCDKLTSVTIGSNVASIENDTFEGCTALESVFYNGTAEEWNEISIGSNNSCLTSATIYYYSETQPTESGNYWRYVDGNIAVWSTEE